MLVVESLQRMGGVATRAALIAATSRPAFERAVAGGEVVLVARGRYALATVDEALVAAHRLTGTVTHASAALRHGWQVKAPPPRPHVAVPRNRVLLPGQDVGVELHRLDLGPDDVDGLVTSRERTLLDCLRAGPFDEALCVDSALREGFGGDRLRAVARDARGPGSRLVRRVAGLADGRAANAFESVLRAIVLEVDGLDVVPPGARLRVDVPRDAGPRRRAARDHPRGRLLRVAREPGGAAPGRTSLRPVRRERLAGPAVRVGGRDVRPGLGQVHRGRGRRRTYTTTLSRLRRSVRLADRTAFGTFLDGNQSSEDRGSASE